MLAGGENPTRANCCLLNTKDLSTVEGRGCLMKVHEGISLLLDIVMLAIELAKLFSMRKKRKQ
jgi:hypothetical protein